MKLFLKYDIYTACQKLLEEQLNKAGLEFSMMGFGEVETKDLLSAESIKRLNHQLNHYGIEIVENQKSILVQKIKDAIMEMVYSEEELPSSKVSLYLAAKLLHSYGYISNIFSELTYTSIESYIILQKIERTKQLITTTNLTLTEISHKLNYSSVAHLSTQFKNTTGLTPTAFRRIMNKRRNTT